MKLLPKAKTLKVGAKRNQTSLSFLFDYTNFLLVGISAFFLER